MAVRVHPFPSRTRQLSSLALKILGWKRPGKIRRCRHKRKAVDICPLLFSLLFHLLFNTHLFYALRPRGPSLSAARKGQKTAEGEPFRWVPLRKPLLTDQRGSAPLETHQISSSPVVGFLQVVSAAIGDGQTVTLPDSEWSAAHSDKGCAPPKPKESTKSKRHVHFWRANLI